MKIVLDDESNKALEDLKRNMKSISNIQGSEKHLYITKDSGKRIDYPSGMKRDKQEGKPRYDLCYQPMFKRWADLMMRGAEKYGENNWQKANSEEEMNRFKASAYRHFFQYINNLDTEEDHAAAIFFNISAIEYLKERLKK